MNTDFSPTADAPPTLLIVDDEPSILSALRRLLRPQGYRVLSAEGGAAALELAATESFDLVISDMRMPSMDGAHFLQQMRLRQPDAIRVLLTGYADVGSTIAAIHDGEIHRYIAKPWDDRDLLLLVREALVRRRLEVHNRELRQLVQQRSEELDRLNVVHAALKRNFTLSMQIFAGLMEPRHDGMSDHSGRDHDGTR